MNYHPTCINLSEKSSDSLNRARKVVSREKDMEVTWQQVIQVVCNAYAKADFDRTPVLR